MGNYQTDKPLTRDIIKEEIRILLSEQIGVEPSDILMQDDLANKFGLDSLDVVELVMEIEDCFEISIPDEDAEQIKTMRDIVNYVWDRYQNGR